MADSTPVKVVVTERDEAEKLKPGVVKTPGDQADIRIVPMTPVRQAFTRATRAYVQNVLWEMMAFMGTAGVSHAALSLTDLPPEAKLAIDFIVAVIFKPLGPSIVCFLQNLIEIWTKLDAKSPELRA